MKQKPPCCGGKCTTGSELLYYLIPTSGFRAKMVYLTNQQQFFMRYTLLLKTGSFLCNSRDLIGLAAMVYKPLYHAREIANIKLSMGLFSTFNFNEGLFAFCV